MIPAFGSQVEEEEPAEQTENRLWGWGTGSLVPKSPRHDVSREVGRRVGQRLEQMCALDLATWRPGLKKCPVSSGDRRPVWRRFLAGGQAQGRI